MEGLSGVLRSCVGKSSPFLAVSNPPNYTRVQGHHLVGPESLAARVSRSRVRA